MTTTKNTKKAASQESVTMKDSNVKLRNAFLESSVALMAQRDESVSNLLKDNPELAAKQDAKKPRSIMSDAAKRNDTHAKHNAILSGLKDGELKALKLFYPNGDAAMIATDSRENKKYISSLCGMIAQNKSRADMLSLSHLNEAMVKVDPNFAKVRVGHASATILLSVLRDLRDSASETFTTRQFKAQSKAVGFDQEGYTQANNIVRMLHKYGLGERTKDGAYWKMKVNMDHDFIKALLAIK